MELSSEKLGGTVAAEFWILRKTVEVEDWEFREVRESASRALATLIAGTPECVRATRVVARARATAAETTRWLTVPDMKTASSSPCKIRPTSSLIKFVDVVFCVMETIKEPAQIALSVCDASLASSRDVVARYYDLGFAQTLAALEFVYGAALVAKLALCAVHVAFKTEIDPCHASIVSVAALASDKSDRLMSLLCDKIAKYAVGRVQPRLRDLAATRCVDVNHADALGTLFSSDVLHLAQAFIQTMEPGSARLWNARRTCADVLEEHLLNTLEIIVPRTEKVRQVALMWRAALDPLCAGEERPEFSARWAKFFSVPTH